MSALPKPVLRGHIGRRGIKILIGSVSFGCVNAALYYFLVAKKNLELYENFVKTYDAAAHYKELVKYGYLQSAKKIKESNKD